jgi:hypothetical protein
MTVVSSKEFVGNEDKYFDLALDEQVFIQKGDNMFLLIYKNVDDMNIYHDASVYEEILIPDIDFRKAITMDEFRKRARVIVENVHNRYLNESNHITESS